MSSWARLIRVVCAVVALGVGVNSQAQNLPGIAVGDSSVNQSAITLVNLATQAFPDMFGQASTWRLYEGFHFKHFNSSGVFVGVRGDELYLLGGPFGDTVTYQGKISDAIAVVQGASGGAAGPFQDYVTARTLLELLGYFRKLTMEYGSSLTVGTTQLAKTDAAIALEVLGQEVVSGASATKLKLTLTGTNLSTPVLYEMWVDTQGVVVKLAMNGFAYDANLSKTIGPGLVSGMLLALVAADAPAVKAVVNNELANNSAVSQKTTNKTIGGAAVQAITISVSTGANAIEVELSDFGPFTIASSYTAVTQSSSTYFRMVDVQLR